MISPAQHDQYRALLAQLSSSLAAGRPEAVAGHLQPAGAEHGVREHLSNAFGERIQMLHEKLDFVALAFDDFEALVYQYMRDVPAGTYHRQSDVEQFLEWLRRTRPLSPQQEDFVAYRGAELSVERLARRKHAAHVRFQQLARARRQAAPADGDPWIHLNPVRVWTRLAAAGAADEGQPCDVVLFPREVCIEASRLDARRAALLRELEEAEPTTVVQWSRGGGDVSQRIALVSDLVQQGLAAVGEMEPPAAD